MPKMKWDWVLVVTVKGIMDDVLKTIPVGPFNNQPAAFDYQHEWLRNHKDAYPEAGEICFEVTKMVSPY